MGTASAIADAGQFVVVVALVYFLLIAGDRFRRTLMRTSGDTLSKKKITLQIPRKSPLKYNAICSCN